MRSLPAIHLGWISTSWRRAIACMLWLRLWTAITEYHCSLLLPAKGACYGTITATAPSPRFSTLSYEASILCHHRGRARAPPSSLLHQAQSSLQIKAQIHRGALPKSSPLRAQFHRRGRAHHRNQAYRRGSKWNHRRQQWWSLVVFHRRSSTSACFQFGPKTL